MSNSLHTGRKLGINRNSHEKIKATLLGGTFNHTLNHRQCPTVEEELDSQSLDQTVTLVLPMDLVTYLNSQGLLGYLISKTVVLNWGAVLSTWGLLTIPDTLFLLQLGGWERSAIGIQQVEPVQLLSILQGIWQPLPTPNRVIWPMLRKSAPE